MGYTTTPSPASLRSRSKRSLSTASFESDQSDDIKPAVNKRKLSELELEPRVDSGGDPAIRKAERKLRNRCE